MRSGSHTVMSLSGRTRCGYPLNHKLVRPLLEFPFIRLFNILHVDVPFVLSNDDGEAGQSMQPITLYLTITVSANMASPILPNNAPKILIEGDDSPAEEATMPSLSPDSEGPIRSTAPEPLLPLPDNLSVEIGVPTSHSQAEVSPTEDPVIALRRADEAMKPIDRSNTWEMAVERINWVMDTLSPIAGVRVMSLCLSFTEPTFTQLHPYARMACGLLLAIPKVHPFASLSEQNTYAMFIGRHS